MVGDGYQEDRPEQPEELLEEVDREAHELPPRLQAETQRIRDAFSRLTHEEWAAALMSSYRDAEGKLRFRSLELRPAPDDENDV